MGSGLGACSTTRYNHLKKQRSNFTSLVALVFPPEYDVMCFYLDISISRPPTLCLAPSTGPGPQFVFTSACLQFVLLALSSNLYLLTLAPNLYLPALVSQEPGLHIPTLHPEFVFTGPGLRFLLQYYEFAFLFLSLVVAVTVIILAMVAIS